MYLLFPPAQYSVFSSGSCLVWGMGGEGGGGHGESVGVGWL
jgi:hypothetical protein